MSDSVHTKVDCPDCEEEIEVAIHPGSEAVFSRIDTSRNCDESPPYYEPEYCPHCDWFIEIDNAGEIYVDTMEGLKEDHYEAQQEARRELEEEGEL